jgi:hypothetical protein
MWKIGVVRGAYSFIKAAHATEAVLYCVDTTGADRSEWSEWEAARIPELKEELRTKLQDPAFEVMEQRCSKDAFRQVLEASHASYSTRSNNAGSGSSAQQHRRSSLNWSLPSEMWGTEWVHEAGTEWVHEAGTEGTEWTREENGAAAGLRVGLGAGAQSEAVLTRALSAEFAGSRAVL